LNARTIAAPTSSIVFVAVTLTRTVTPARRNLSTPPAVHVPAMTIVTVAAAPASSTAAVQSSRLGTVRAA